MLEHFTSQTYAEWQLSFQWAMEIPHGIRRDQIMKVTTRSYPLLLLITQQLKQWFSECYAMQYQLLHYTMYNP
jgi:hypothetical protein